MCVARYLRAAMILAEWEKGRENVPKKILINHRILLLYAGYESFDIIFCIEIVSRKGREGEREREREKECVY